MLLAQAAAAAGAPAVDLLIRGGTVHDGGEGPGWRADVGISGERIVFVGDAAAAQLTARRTLDATGRIVAPGFIDPHTHAGVDLFAPRAARRTAINHLTQGVTTVFVGNDGEGAPDALARLRRAEAAGIGVNAATFVGFGAVRSRVMGARDGAPTADELRQMQALVAQAMCAGALGFSAGLYYAPQSYADTAEVVALAREAASRGGLYETHLRDEGSDSIGLLAAVEEVLEIGRSAGLPVHFAHIKALGVDAHGLSGRVIARIEAEQASGRRISADQYPWAASGTRVSNALVPRWIMVGGADAMRAALRRRGGPQSLLLTSGPFAGETLAARAAAWDVDPVEAAIRIVRDHGDARVASFNMIEADIRAFAARRWVVSSSDGTSGHPRKYGSFPLRWQKFVRDAPLMSAAEFVRRSSGLTADIFGLPDRGYLRSGYFADVVVFDPQTFAARADYAHPERLSTGVVHLLVNGAVAIENGRPTHLAAGRALARVPPPGACP